MLVSTAVEQIQCASWRPRESGADADRPEAMRPTQGNKLRGYHWTTQLSCAHLLTCCVPPAHPDAGVPRPR